MGHSVVSTSTDHFVTNEHVESYRRDGFVVIEDVLSDREVDRLRQVTDALVNASRDITDHDEVYDLEPNHSPIDPRVRRIKQPHKLDPAFSALVNHPKIIQVLQKLMHPHIRFDVSKLNLKSAGYGAAVEWHQDWAFYPHTNDDLAAVGVMMDDMLLENGPLLCIPRSHRGSIFNHHDDSGYFCGAIDPSRNEIDFDSAEACIGRAGSISIHHVRTVHGSAVNSSTRPRRLLLLQYRAADAWPLIAKSQSDLETWKSLLVTGDVDPIQPRCERVPIRLPLPAAQHQGSIYENQRTLKRPYFSTGSV